MKGIKEVAREVVFSDFTGIIDLLIRNKMGRSLESLKHLWEHNPVFLAQEKWPIGWVIENTEKQITGFLANIPVEYYFKGKNILAAVASTWVVDMEYRKFSMSLVKNYFKQNKPELFIDASANEIASKVFERFFKAKRIPVFSYDTVLFWIMDYKRFAEAAVSRCKKLIIIKHFINVFAYIANAISKNKNYVKNPKYDICCIENFDERFDVFWERLKNKRPALLCYRDMKSLSWHFKYALLKKKAWIFVVEKNHEIVSYSVFIRQDNSGIGLKRMRLADFQSLEDDLFVLRDMVSFAIAKCRSNDVCLLEIFGLDFKKISILKKLYPFSRKLKNPPFFYKTRNIGLAKELEGQEIWDPVLYDGDVSL